MAKPKRRVSILAILGGALGTICLCLAGVSVIGRGLPTTPTPAPAAIAVTIMAPTAAPQPTATLAPIVAPAPASTMPPPTAVPPTSAPTAPPAAQPTSPPAADQPVASVPADQNMANVRAGPGMRYQVIGQLLSGKSAPIIGRARISDAMWWQIPWPGGPGEMGWVADQVVDVSGSTLGVPDGVILAQEPTAVPVEAAPAPTQAPAAAPCNCSGPDLNCPDFTTRASAQACWDACGGKAGGPDPFGLDRDGNGLACESLP